MPPNHDIEGDFSFSMRNINGILKIAKKQIKHGVNVPSNNLASEVAIIVMYCTYLFEVRFARDLISDELYSEIRPINQVVVNGDFHVKITMDGNAKIIDDAESPTEMGDE